MRERNVPTKLSVYVYNPDPNGENCILDRNLRANVYLLIFLLNLASYARSPFTSRDRGIKATTERNKTSCDAKRWRKISAKRFINLQVIKRCLDVINLSLSWQPDLEAFSVSFTSPK